MRSIFISAKTSKVKDDLGISGLLHCGLLGDVEAVKELPDILVLHGGRLLDEGRRLGHALDGVALQKNNQLISQLGNMHVLHELKEVTRFSFNAS